MSNQDEKTFCCVHMERAFESGTDNEGYMALASLREDGRIEIGDGLPLLEYCPWCGHEFCV